MVDYVRRMPRSTPLRPEICEMVNNLESLLCDIFTFAFDS